MQYRFCTPAIFLRLYLPDIGHPLKLVLPTKGIS
jgi:hypothetical protein